MQPLSFSQRGLWFLDQLAPGDPAYVFQADYEIIGPLDLQALSKAVDHIVLRHEVLRSRIAISSGTPYSVVMPPGRPALAVFDLRGSPEGPQQASGFLREQEQLPFDLATGPLLRVGVVRVADDVSILHLNVHHAVFDGESHRIFERELTAVYESFLRGTAPRLPPLPFSYATFAARQNAWLEGPDAAREMSFWAQRLRDITQAEIPADRPRATMNFYAGDEVTVRFSDEVKGQISAISRAQRMTFFMVMLAAYQYLLSRYTGTRDIVVGAPFLGRTSIELEQLIGFFVNTLALRCTVRGDLSFAALAAQVRGVVLEAADHQEIPFERVVAHLAPERDSRRNPVFQNWFDFSGGPAESESGGLVLAGTACRRIQRPATAARFDTEFHVVMTRSGLSGKLVYASELFSRTRMQRLAGHYVAVLGALVRDPHQRLAEHPFVPELEARHVIELGCAPGPVAPGRTLTELFDESAGISPDAAAVTDGATRLTYRELREKADRVAGWLRASGAGPEQVVGVCLPRRTGLVVALLGVVRAGAVYLPMNPELPAARLAFMLADTATAYVVTCASLRHLVPPGVAHVLLLDDPPPVTVGGCLPASDVQPDNALYVIYTSGSTGEPKGVVVTHRSFANLAGWHLGAYGVSRGQDVVSATANVVFDAAGWEIWPALLGGALLDIVPPDRITSPEALAEHFRRAGTTGAFLPTPLAEQVIRMPLTRTRLRYLLTGGDVFRPREQDAPGVPVFNHYGPTEATVVATAGDALGPPWPDISIGRPITGVRAYVLDRYLHPVPEGVSGELFLGGAGIGRGYGARPALTAARFMPDPFVGIEGARMYRTGDMARWRSDRTLQFLGRADRQIKLRGLRIEPGEVESAILGYGGIRETAATLVGGHGGRGRLVAYLTAAGGEVDLAGLREYLLSRLPGYMIPAAFVVIETMPHTSSGKVDLSRLPDPDLARRASTPPAGPVERSVARLWSQVLAVDGIGVGDDFFELGGNSLSAAQLAAMTSDLFGVSVPVRAIFDRRTVAGLSSAVMQQIRVRFPGMTNEDIAAALRELEPKPASGHGENGS